MERGCRYAAAIEFRAILLACTAHKTHNVVAFMFGKKEKREKGEARSTTDSDLCRRMTTNYGGYRYGICRRNQLQNSCEKIFFRDERNDISKITQTHHLSYRIDAQASIHHPCIFPSLLMHASRELGAIVDPATSKQVVS